ncbi:MAG: RimK/LysX family protein [Bacteriovoracaceae bacterium]|nr:RimK/LysX family protein [Bacteriovoracaceae bacterium]
MKKMKLGWREWVGIPEMGLPAIKAKIDTGAKTSSLHALDPEPCTIEGVPHVRFILMPVQRSLALGRDIVAPLVDKRSVKNSGGEGEERFVISLILALGDVEKEIEVTLANRRDMKFRMLLGRQALEGCLIDPAQSYLLGKTQEQKQFLRQLSKDLLW